MFTSLWGDLLHATAIAKVAAFLHLVIFETGLVPLCIPSFDLHVPWGLKKGNPPPLLQFIYLLQ